MSGAPRGRQLALLTILLSTLLIAAGYVSAFRERGAPPWATWTLVLGIPCLLVGLMALGVARRKRGIGRVLLPLASVWLLLAGGFAGVLLLQPAETANTTLWLGLPPRAAMILYGIGLLPVLVLPVAYGLTFDAATLSEDDLERVRAARRDQPTRPAGS